MQVETNKDRLCINQTINKKTENIMVEGDVIVPDIKPDILNTIHSSGTICVYKKELIDGKIRIDGCINLYIIYLADADENVRSLNTTLDFTKMVNMGNSNKDMEFNCDLKLRDIECRVLNGRKINIKANVDADLETYSNNQIEFIQDIQGIKDIKLLDKPVSVNSLMMNNKTKIFAKDTINMEDSDDLAEIMGVTIKIINKDKKISYNKVLAKADACVDIMYLTANNKIRNVKGVIPIVGFIDIENISEGNICDIKYEIKNMIIKPNSASEHSIYTEIELEVACAVYESKKINMIQDLYSPTFDLKVNSKNIEAKCIKENLKNNYKLQEKQLISEINDGKLYQVEVMPIITNQKVLKDKILFEGEITLDFIFESNTTQGISTKRTVIPFTNEFEKDGVNSNLELSSNIEIIDQNFKVGSDGMIDLNLDIEFDINILDNVRMNAIDSVEIDESRVQKISSIIIYFVKQGDTLWEIAKRFKSTVEDIAQVNGIEDVDNINIGMQLFIPRYVA